MFVSFSDHIDLKSRFNELKPYCGTLNRYIDIIQEFEFCFITKYCYRKLSLYSNQLNNKWRISFSFAHSWASNKTKVQVSIYSSTPLFEEVNMKWEEAGLHPEQGRRAAHACWQPDHFPLLLNNNVKSRINPSIL